MQQVWDSQAGVDQEEQEELKTPSIAILHTIHTNITIVFFLPFFVFRFSFLFNLKCGAIKPKNVLC